uniref:tRNA(Ile)-lysidine synthetase n=1 Tax=Leersia perrieri TaxID=77586 RepID=A0A0D9VEJ4_9ORYZ
MPLLLFLLPLPLRSAPLRRLLLCRCCSSASPISSSSAALAPYHQSFARRMALTGVHPHHRVAVGVSGGPDSMALCVLAAAWKKAADGGEGDASGFVDGLLGVVVDHGLRTESAEEARLVRERVRGMGVMCEIATCEWPDGRPKQGRIQEAAREMRYQKLLDICLNQRIAVLLIAHHSDDQAELFVLRLSRNSGVLGLAGTAFVSQLFAPNLKFDGDNFSRYGIILVRPMLEFSKDDMYKICQGSNHLWVEDPTNNSMLYVRNRIRASLISLSTEGTFLSELHKLISECRLTRAYIDNACSMVLKKSLTVMEHGYAVIDLEKLDPHNVDDLCLSQYLTYILQFVSQRHRPLRGRCARLLMDYIRTTPCKAALTVAGCYLSAVPRSKGTKVLVCCSVDLMESSSVDMSYKCSYVKQPPPVSDINQIVTEARIYSDQFPRNCPNIPFLSSKFSTDVLNKAKDLKLINDYTLEKLNYLRADERQKFIKTKEHEQEQYLETGFPCLKVLNLWPGETCHFMGRFLITWRTSEVVNTMCLHDSQKHICQYCMVNQDGSLVVRHMVDTDWLFVAEVCKTLSLEENKNDPNASCNKLEDDKLVQHSRYLQLSAMKSLEILRSIPAPARRTLPVLTNSQGDILSIPSIDFRCCPSLLIEAVFSPRVPLGGGYTSYL